MRVCVCVSVLVFVTFLGQFLVNTPTFSRPVVLMGTKDQSENGGTPFLGGGVSFGTNL